MIEILIFLNFKYTIDTQVTNKSIKLYPSFLYYYMPNPTILIIYSRQKTIVIATFILSLN